MKPLTYTLPQKHTYAANAVTTVELPISGYIPQIDLLVRENITTASAVLKGDAMARLIKSIQIRSSQSKNWWYTTDQRQHKYLAYLNLRGQIQEDTLPATGGPADYYALYPIHWGVNWFDPHDKSVILPARETQNLVMDVTWGQATDLGTNTTVNSADITLTIHELALDAMETRESAWPAGLLVPRMEPVILTPGGTFANLGYEYNIPTGDTLVQTVIMVVDTNDARSDLDVTEVGLRFPKRRETPFAVDWDQLKYANRANLSLPAAVPGVVLWDWKTVTRRPAGLDASAFMIGDCKLIFTVGVATGKIHLLHYMLG